MKAAQISDNYIYNDEGVLVEQERSGQVITSTQNSSDLSNPSENFKDNSKKS